MGAHVRGKQLHCFLNLRNEFEPPELLFLDAGEGVVDDRKHQVHQEVEVDGEVPE